MSPDCQLGSRLGCGHHGRGDDGAHAGRLDRTRQFVVDGIDHEGGGDRCVQPGDTGHGRLVTELA